MIRDTVFLYVWKTEHTNIEMKPNKNPSNKHTYIKLTHTI